MTVDKQEYHRASSELSIRSAESLLGITYTNCSSLSLIDAVVFGGGLSFVALFLLMMAFIR